MLMRSILFTLVLLIAPVMASAQEVNYLYIPAGPPTIYAYFSGEVVTTIHPDGTVSAYRDGRVINGVEPLRVLPGEAIALPLEFQPVSSQPSSQTHRNHGWGFKTLMVTNVAIMGADVGGTMAAIETGKVREINPIARWVVEKDPIWGGAFNGAMTGTVLLMVDKVAQNKPKLANAILVTYAVLRGYVAFKNNRDVYEMVRNRNRLQGQ